MHLAGACCVTREKHGHGHAARVLGLPRRRTSGVMWAQHIVFISFDATKNYPQHLCIKRFLANSEDTVKSQLWHAIATDVVIAIVKKEFRLDASLHTCRQILSASVFENPWFHAPCRPTAVDPAHPIAH